MNNTLESYKIFPYVAWVLVIGFALFTYMLATRLINEVGSISNGMTSLEVRVERLENAQKNLPK